MPNLFKDFFYFSRGERRGILTLIAVIGIVLLSGYLISAWQHRGDASPADIAEQIAARQEYEQFMASLEEKKEPRKKQYASHGRKEENAPIALSPYIYIAPEDTAHNTPQLYIPQPIQAENMKYASGTVIDLNLADTTELKKIPGIGSGIARLIVGYRQQLGGFYQIEQLKDIHLDTRQLQAWFSIEPTGIHRINLNRSSVDRLRTHPYINFYQAKAIVEYRKKKGTLTSLKPFALYEEFTEADLERISHYVCFE